MSKNTLITVGVILASVVGLYIILSQEPVSTKTPPEDNPITLNVTPSNQNPMTDLKIEDLVVGTGPEVKTGDTVEMNYVGTLEDGTKFDSSYDRGQTFTTQIGVGQVIKGWDEGVPGMKVGGKRRLTIPAAMAYGSRGAGDVIPPNANLIFEVELVSIK